MFISEVVKGGAAELDGRLMQGDQILSVDGEDARHASQEAVAAILKVSRTLAITSCCSGSVFHLKKVTFKKITAESDLTHTHTHTHTCVSSSALVVPSSWSWDVSKLLPGFGLEEVR